MTFTFGNAFDRFFRLLGSNIGPFAAIGLIFTVLPTMVMVYLEFTYMGISQTDPTWIQRLPTASPQFWIMGGVAWLVMLLFSMMSLSAVTEVAILRSVDKPVNFGSVIGSALKNAIPLLIIEIFVVLLITGGFILLVIPGIIWSLCASVSVPAYVGQPGVGIFGAIGKSFQLTRNHRWSLLLLFIAMFFIAGIASGALEATTNGLPGGLVGMPSLLSRAFINSVFALLWQVLVASIYVSLRSSKDKTTPDAAAAVF